ncbi:MAG: MarR family winged helix-turn-helix transcriptional regulator [Ktedonobacterales bacterium]
MPPSHARSGMEDDNRSYLAYRCLSQVFIELDDGDKRFLRALSQTLWADDGDYVLTVPHFWALVHLGVPDGRTMSELAHLLICDPSNVTAIVDKLEEREWAQRLRGKAGDRRYMRVVLTPAGWSVRRQVNAAYHQWVQRRLAVLSHDQLDHLIELLRVMHRATLLDTEQAVAEITDMLAEVGSLGGGHTLDAPVRN